MLKRRPEGDSHRFGKKVIGRVSSDGGFYFSKPRSVELERLFLCADAVPVCLRPFLPYTPNLHVKSASTWQGEASALNSLLNADSLRRDQSNDYSRRAGKLLAIATFLGIIDLHYENVLLREETLDKIEPVPVDIEIAFWDCISVIDTNLIPSTKTDLDKAGLNGRMPEPYQPKDPAILLDAFLEASTSLQSLTGDILTDLESSIRDHPIRVLLRGTSEYRKLLKNTSANLSQNAPPLLLEEQLQLNANDIPYFFTFREQSPSLYYFSAPDVISKCEARHFDPILNNASKPITLLASTKRLERLRMVSALHIFKAYHQCWPETALDGEHFAIKRDGEQFVIETPWFKASASIR